MSIEFDLDVAVFDKWMDDLAEAAPPAVARGMHAKAELTMTRSKADFVPIDTGALRASGNVETKIEGTSVQTSLGYGGPAVNYAVPVHEQNRNYKGGRQWKYLETPLKQDLPSYPDGIADELNKAFGG
jgi:hypothetical protein